MLFKINKCTSVFRERVPACSMLSLSMKQRGQISCKMFEQYILKKCLEVWLVLFVESEQMIEPDSLYKLKVD